MRSESSLNSALGEKPASSFYWLKEGQITCMGYFWCRHPLPNRGEQLVVPVTEHSEAWPQAWLSSLEAFSHAWNAFLPCGASGHRGDSCGARCPLRLTGRSAEGAADGDLVLVKGRTASEGCCSCMPRFLQRREYTGLAAQWREQCQLLAFVNANR